MGKAGANEGMGHGVEFNITVGKIHYNYSPSKNCVNGISHEGICIKCGKCGRMFDDEGRCINYTGELKSIYQNKGRDTNG